MIKLSLKETHKTFVLHPTWYPFTIFSSVYIHPYLTCLAEVSVKVTVQFETDGNDQNETISHSERSIVNLDQ